MKEPKECGRRELHTLFTKIATIIEEHGDDAGVYDFIDMKIEPLVEAFIADHFCDVRPEHITIHLWIWFEQWRTSRDVWAHPLSSLVRRP
jgi:hypothetical protein